MDNKIEIIEFKNPTTERLRIAKIQWHDESGEAGLIHLIRRQTSSFGLVHSVIAKEESENGDSSANFWYAYVDMYSQKAIENAYKYLKANLGKLTQLKHIPQGDQLNNARSERGTDWELFLVTG